MTRGGGDWLQSVKVKGTEVGGDWEWECLVFIPCSCSRTWPPRDARPAPHAGTQPFSGAKAQLGEAPKLNTASV